jgi:mannose-6-phosphate isomerase-like protein (cupin superfamily)
MSLNNAPRTHDPLHHVQMAFQREGDERLWVYAWLDDGGHLPEHFHPTLEEHWEVVEGMADMKVDGTWQGLTSEDGVVVIKRGIRHALRNRSGGEARLRAEVLPAGRLEEFLTESAHAARDGLFTASGMPTSLRGAAWVSEFALRFMDETVMCSPPPAVQRAVLPLVARLTERYRPALLA